nr:hypothetical protein [Tanacetum cinerariifolium]
MLYIPLTTAAMLTETNEEPQNAPREEEQRGNSTASNEKVAANLANFAYDPFNQTFLRQELVAQFQNASTEASKEKVAANLANFAYDPFNHTFLRQILVLPFLLRQTNRLLVKDPFSHVDLIVPLSKHLFNQDSFLSHIDSLEEDNVFEIVHVKVVDEVLRYSVYNSQHQIRGVFREKANGVVVPHCKTGEVIAADVMVAEHFRHVILESGGYLTRMMNLKFIFFGYTISRCLGVPLMGPCIIRDTVGSIILVSRHSEVMKYNEVVKRSEVVKRREVHSFNTSSFKDETSTALTRTRSMPDNSNIFLEPMIPVIDGGFELVMWPSRPPKSKLPRYPQSVHMMLVKK